MKEKENVINDEKIYGEVVETYENGNVKKIIFSSPQNIKTPIGNLKCKDFVSFHENGNLANGFFEEQKIKKTEHGNMIMDQEFKFNEEEELIEIKYHLVDFDKIETTKRKEMMFKEASKIVVDKLKDEIYYDWKSSIGNQIFNIIKKMSFLNIPMATLFDISQNISKRFLDYFINNVEKMSKKI